MIYKQKIDNEIIEKGYLFGIQKEQDESITNFFRRIRLSLNHKRNSMSALGFCTKFSEQNLFEITQFVERNDPPRIKFNLNNIEVWRRASLSNTSEPDYTKRYEEIKFLIDFVNWMESLLDTDENQLITIKVMQYDDSWHYIHTKKILKIDSLHFRGEYPLMNYHSQRLPNDYIFDLYFNNFEKEYIEVPVLNLNASNKYFFDNTTSTLIRYVNDSIEEVNYYYSDFPLILKLNHFEMIAYEDKQFDEIVLDKVKYESQSLEHKKLNQTGAKYYNELLKLSNYHWGK
jgi:hypothetical protein